jgi:tRNA-Thr(GGU) m(6)t(6)A37 methyltransferase TsaA
MEITYQPIGIIRSPFKTTEGMPIQPSGAKSIKGEVEIYPKFIEGLKDLDGFSHIILIYHFHKVTGSKLTVIPFLDSKPRGVFSTRAPVRPNHIGFSIVKLLKIENNFLHIENIDILDKTPLLDIKPYVPEFDISEVKSVGWLERVKKQVKNQKSDKRFNK